MKSYFAKLADRATLANVTAPSAVHAPRVLDPFDEIAIQQTPLPISEKDSRTTSVPEPSGIARTRLVEDSRQDQARSIVETPKSIPSEPITEVTTLQPKQLETDVISDRSALKASVETKPVPTSQHEATNNLDDSKVALTPREPPQSGAPVSREQPVQERDRESDSVDVRMSELELEQALLLRKADAFMSNLLDIRKHVAPKNDHDEGEPSQFSLSKPEAPPVNRLEPVQHQRDAPPQAPDGPSLVIGKLTVEVTPSTPSATPQQPQRIVVRGAGGRRNGMTSTRRFGLRQF